MTDFVVMMSGGGGSWAAARRIADKHGTDRMTLLFTDVKGEDRNAYLGEDDDTYRFLNDATKDIGAPLIRLEDGRNIWDVFYEKGWLGNSSLSHCSWELKTRPAREWLDLNRDIETTTVVIGMDWTETHRHAAVYRGYAHGVEGCANPALCKSLFDADGRLPGPGCKNLLLRGWTVAMPMNDKPRIAKPQVIRLMKERRLKPPRMYKLGFAHANCIGCVKGGQAHWARVLEVFPKHFAEAEQREEDFRTSKPSRADTSILKDRAGGGPAKPLSLSEFRRKKQNGEISLFELDFDWGGCGCFTDEVGAA